jgi:hypothetical protein
VDDTAPRALALRQILFFVWVIFAEHKWVILGERRSSVCGECNKELGKGALLLMEADPPLCLSCADLDHLIYLPKGDAALTRRAAIVDDSILGRLS